MLTLLHTSDWHLGRRLYGKPRYEEFAKFLAWQLEVIQRQQVDILIIAGDIFDTSSPSNQAQALYYDFLHQVSQTDCRHVVIVGGNHDSPSFLDAPKALLKGFNIHVVGSMSEQLHDELLVLTDANQIPEIIIAAVPYLRDRDVRLVSSGERIDDKESKLVAGISAHYQVICQLAHQKQSELMQQYQRYIPIVGTGHLFVAGGTAGDGVRELYVGSLAHVSADIFAPTLDYVALGHLHVPQMVSQQSHIRYSGSPIAMGFGEATQQKQVNLVRFFADDSLIQQSNYTLVRQAVSPVASLSKINTARQSATTVTKTSRSSTAQPAILDLFADAPTDTDNLSTTKLSVKSDNGMTQQPLSDTSPQDLSQPYNLGHCSLAQQDTMLIQSLAVPTFQHLHAIKGDWPHIVKQINALKACQLPIWLEVTYDGQAVMGDLRERVAELVIDSQLEVLRLKNLQIQAQTLQAQRIDETLDELDETQVFDRLLAAKQVPTDQHAILWRRYGEVIEALKDSL